MHRCQIPRSPCLAAVLSIRQVDSLVRLSLSLECSLSIAANDHSSNKFHEYLLTGLDTLSDGEGGILATSDEQTLCDSTARRHHWLSELSCGC